MSILLKNATLIVGREDKVFPHSDVLIQGTRIAAVGPTGTLQTPPEAEVIDLAGRWLLPGLIDLHTHLYTADYMSGNPKLEPEAYVAFKATCHVRDNLMAGVTTIRELGTQNRVGISTRRAVREGLITGSRVFSSGLIICQTGGHGSELPFTGREADGEADIRRAVREQWKAGADLIKVAINGAQNVVELSLEELKALVDEAHRLNLKVSCHASILPAALNAALAGVDTLEHGCELDRPVVEMMVDKGIVLVPTIVVLKASEESMGSRPIDPTFARAVEMRRAAHRQSFELALEAGVVIGAGTDICVPYKTVAALPEELSLMVSWGMSPMQAIQSATGIAADALGQGDNLGAVEPGKLADLVVVDRNPVTDIGALQDVSLVIQDGRIVRGG